jgi:histone H3/H4
MPKKRRYKNGGLTINIRTACKSVTKFNVSKDTMYELKNYLEDVIIPKMIITAEKYSKSEGKNTIQERDYLRARDYINVALSQV